MASWAGDREAVENEDEYEGEGSEGSGSVRGCAEGSVMSGVLGGVSAGAAVGAVVAWACGAAFLEGNRTERWSGC